MGWEGEAPGVAGSSSGGQAEKGQEVGWACGLSATGPFLVRNNQLVMIRFTHISGPSEVEMIISNL